MDPSFLGRPRPISIVESEAERRAGMSFKPHMCCTEDEKDEESTQKSTRWKIAALRIIFIAAPVIESAVRIVVAIRKLLSL